jgi:DNA-directed RNA polymerase subunit L
MSKIVVDSMIETKDHLEFDLTQIDLSLINALRRTLLTQIPSLVIRGFPHKENCIDITKNNTRYNNEYLKHRLSCIPIIYSNQKQFNKIIKDYVLKIKLKNDTMDKLTLTTEHIKLYNKEGKPNKGNIFLEPPIPICYLYPRISLSEPSEEFEATISLSIGTAKQDACWNMVSKCLFYNKEDDEKNETLLEQLPEQEKADFKLLDAQRNYIEDAYRFVIETIGVYDNKTLITMACENLIKTIQEYSSYMGEVKITSYIPNIPQEGLFHIYKKSMIDKDVLYIIKIEDDDYTYGKLIEKYMYNKFSSSLKFVAFKKEHPHDKHSLIQIVFLEQNSDLEDSLKQNLLNIFKDIIVDLKHIQNEFKI